MVKPGITKDKDEEEWHTKLLTYAQTICYLIGVLFFLLGSSIAVYIASNDLKEGAPSSPESALLT
ncbi:hypothetical protein JOD43_002735 [Pullulanibacillus pueri]|uniref:Uncharacterized protein n=1 Tax=Pullulanibacillus pueri TaxID=1437324 RepID=A0A8J3EMA8_9BACL|nr:hypothetical protein [Pullulanibacillus pueri]MBM7682557.1 hypothetical protein [Pullulanibacillus pueri]GGH81929.1 hypothetical protein GCM10007096_20550 [Pullulanibacillus pueri]